MRYILFTFILIPILSFSYVDPDKKAFSLLNSMSDNYKKMKGFSTTFTYSMINLTENISDSFEGKIFVKGDKSVPYGIVVETMSRIHSAGFTKVALISDIKHK